LEYFILVGNYDYTRRTGIGKYINIYNKERLHQSLDYATPDEVYFGGVNNKVFENRDLLLDVA